MELHDQLELKGETRDVHAHREVQMFTASESMPIVRQWDHMRMVKEEAIAWAVLAELGLVASSLEAVTC